jgi:Fic/DOC family
MSLFVTSRWTDVDPATHAYDRVAAHATIRECFGHGLLPPAADRREDLEARITRALVAGLGSWAGGWNWSSSEPGGGGPVGEYCCAEHSLTFGKVVAALDDWRSFLEQTGSLFTKIRADAPRPDPSQVERAAAQILPLIVERTGASDAWYHTFATVLTWFLDFAGYDPAVIGPAVHETISGRFSSWVEPSEELAAQTAKELDWAVRTVLTAAPMTGDALRDWLAVRARAFQMPLPPRERDPVRHDGHARFIEGAERERDLVRARRMGEALQACRSSAGRQETLTFDLLAGWQAIVLGVPRVTFRSGDALAKSGRERYARDADTPQRFASCLAEANDARVTPAVCAARAYLDVCFFHPFEDGNARAGLALHSIEPFVHLARTPSDAVGAWQLANLIDYLAGPRAERH